MKMYDKQYEDVFKRTLDKRCNLEKVGTFKNNPESIDKYIRLYQETFGDMYASIFDNLVKLIWLRRRFVYNRKRAIKKGRNGIAMDRALSLFIRNYAGYDARFILMTNGPFSCIANYLDDFFPNFNEGNPFEENYEYPYKYMRLEALVIVHQMEERLELLEYGEKKKMNIETFKDFVINYINCYNEEHGEKYLFIYPGGFLAYVALAKNYRKRRKI